MCMTIHTHSTALERSYQQLIYPYAPYIQYAVTLTLKLRAKIRVKRFENYGAGGYYEYWTALNTDTINSTIRRFNARLTAALYGNLAKHKNKQTWAKPLVIAVVEGGYNGKRPHLHIALGNVPEAKQATITNTIKQVWSECDFGYRETDIQQVYGEYGWLNYITKTTGFTGQDALAVSALQIPAFIQQST